MKIFTVGLEEKSPTKDNPASPDGATTLTTTPIITLEKKRTSYKNYVMCLGTLSFIFVFAIIITKLIFYRIPSDFEIPWFELKHRMAIGCDDCRNARIIQSFYPQRFPRIFESSNHEAAPAALAINAEQPQAIEQATSITSISQPSVDLPQTVDSRLDFLRKIIPKIKEQAEKSGIEGVMQVKVLQMESFEPNQLLDKLNENQLQPVRNEPQPIESMAATSHPTLLDNFLHWNAGENDENQISGNQFVGSQQDNMAKSEPMLMLAPFLQARQLELLPALWENINNNIAFHLFDLAQQINRQKQSSNFWQSPWPNPAYSKNNNEKVAAWQSQQYLATPVVQQIQPNPFIPWEAGNHWQDNAQMGFNWQNGIQNQNQWPQNGWQEYQGYQNPQTSMNQNQYQNNNDWDVQRANILDNLDGRMNQAILLSDNLNNYNSNNNADDHWMRHYNQWHINNQRSQQQPIANTAVSQSLEVIEPGFPYQVQNQSPKQQEQEHQQQLSQIMASQQSQTILEHQIKPLSTQAQQQKQQSQIEQPFLNQPQIQQQTNAMPSEVFQQSANIPISRSEPDDNPLREIAPLHFNNDNWKETENLNLSVGSVGSINDKQEQLLHQEPSQLSIHPVESDSSDSSKGMKVVDDDPNKITFTEKAFQQSGPVNDISSGLSNPILFQVDEPSPQFANIDESFAK
ncbi:hypothetical protein X798_01654 [Onchocerca flexuosa]|uniref:Peroxin-14 n=2 Tax=Onchocerca flexuosa TaxID=387005 RepID=A0A183H4P4_9BILA|nr:hypothetical protein X798_01654 [Onchocerca flexuosa]VDO33029.1 unnamed protein product [Onchocerca flexuosa]